MFVSLFRCKFYFIQRCCFATTRGVIINNKLKLSGVAFNQATGDFIIGQKNTVEAIEYFMFQKFRNSFGLTNSLICSWLGLLYPVICILSSPTNEACNSNCKFEQVSKYLGTSSFIFKNNTNGDWLISFSYTLSS